ncbi:hypothetical protein [Ekhidna sp.]|uniref:hypothetical protein n=1 Tax=Ekhidna sp. TaxID=2608089 RepID=UPI003CCBB54B
MNRSFLQLEYSGWWVIVIIIAAALGSYFLYTKKKVPWTSTQNWILASIRFLAILSLALLLLTPSVRQVTNTVQRPVVAIAVDNSESVPARGTGADDILLTINEIKEQLEDIDLEVEIINFNDSADFNYSTSNLTQLLEKATAQTDEKNLRGIILATDGIYNRGSSPLYKNFITPIYTLGLGDTIPSKDLSISRVLYNKISYLDNETPIRIELRQNGFLNERVRLQLTENGKLLDRQELELSKQVQEVTFNIKSETEGLRHIIASVTPLKDETTLENNRSNIFMEVVDGSQKVLIVANAPHPDIKAIRNTLNETGNYQTDIYIPGIHDEKPNEIFDVVIFHGAFTSGVKFTPKENPGKWYILSNESSITSVNKSLSFVNIERRGSQPDKVVGSFNQNFSKFKIEDVSAFEDYPPIQVPFGNYNVSGPTEIVMYQRLGSVKTDKPLMVIYDDGSDKNAVLFGQNIWQWKLQEAAINGNANQFDNLITKTIQFLAIKNDKKQFRFEIQKRNITDSEPAQFEAEVYNDIYERIYNNNISITITSSEGDAQNYSFTDSEYNSTFRSPTFPPGIYQYVAEVRIGDTRFTDRGEFSVQDINPEYINLTADHKLLKNLAEKTGGSYAHRANTNQLIADVESRDFKSKIKSEESLIPLYKTWWWYLIIFLLFSSEWFLRKYWGGY